MGDPLLDDVTLILSDNNVGYTRTLPTKEMRDHPGGYGMYYHMDMHGGPYSFKWIGATYLPRVWEQMTQAYEFGVRQIWVTNVGDIGTQELGLSYFLDLAYDIDKWGGTDAGITLEYVNEWVERQFGGMLPLSGRNKAKKILWDYTGLLEKRRHEIMNTWVYHPLHFGEADRILAVSDEILKESANLMKMWILAGRNELFAYQNRIEANDVADDLDKCVKEDARLIDEYEEVDGGFYKGFGRSEHVGFVNWNEEDNRYPIRHLVYGANSPRMLVSRADDENYMTGLEWCDRPQTWSDMLRPDVDRIEFDLISGSEIPYRYRIRTDCSWLEFSCTEGEVSKRERITLKVNKALLSEKATGTFLVEGIGIGTAHVTVEAAPADAPEGLFIESDGYICMEAEHFVASEDTTKGSFKVLSPYGRSGSAIKVFPVATDFYREKKRPNVTYRFLAEQAGEYDITFELAPATP